MGVKTPIRVALIDDYDVVLAGIANMLVPYRDRVRVVETDANEPLATDVDVALFDSFAQPTVTDDHIATLVRNPRARHVAVYTWNFRSEAIEHAMRHGAHGYLSKTLPARDLVDALVAICAGEIVVSPSSGRARSSLGHDWPGRIEGLSERQAEILALITQGKRNDEIADLMFLSPNTIKSYIRDLYRKIGVDSRTQAVLWGVAHGFTPDHDRITQWRT